MSLKSIEFIKLKDELSKIINEKCYYIFHLYCI